MHFATVSFEWKVQYYKTAGATGKAVAVKQAQISKKKILNKHITFCFPWACLIPPTAFVIYHKYFNITSNSICQMQLNCSQNIQSKLEVIHN